MVSRSAVWCGVVGKTDPGVDELDDDCAWDECGGEESMPP